MQQHTESKSNLDQIHGRLSDARHLEEGARQRLFDAEEERKFWEALDSPLQQNYPSAVLLVLREEEQRVRRMGESSDALAPVIEEIRSMCTEEAAQTAKSFGRAFPEAAKKAGIDIDKTSRHPRYTVKQGFIHLEINDSNYTAGITPRDGNQRLLGLDLTPLVERLKQEIDRLFGRNFQPEAFLRSLFTAYVGVVRAEHRPDGEEVPLRRITNRLSKNLNRFSADEFNVDLARLVTAGRLVIDDLRMHLNHTRKPRQGMLLYGLEEGGYIGFISFKKEVQA